MIWLESFIERMGQDYRNTFENLGLNTSALKLFTFGAVIVAFLLLEPRGLARLWQRIKDYFRLWPFRY
jgi:branched-chain amino acid transport system permease protein